MWQAVTDAVGTAERDALWSHPDLVPTADDIDDPAALIARLRAGAPEPDDVDRAIEDLLADTGGDRPAEGGGLQDPDTAPESGPNAAPDPDPDHR